MVCKTCGNQLNANDKFCRYCGTTVPVAPQENAAPYGSGGPAFNPTYTPVNQNAQNPVNNAYTPGNQGTYNPYGRQTYTPGNQQAYMPGNQQTYMPGNQQTYMPGNQQAYAPVSQQPKAGGKYSTSKAPKAPKTPGKNPFEKLGKKGLIIGAAVAAVVVIALIVALVVSGNPSVKVATAMKNTADEFSAVADIWKLDEASEVLQKEAASVDLDLKINSISEYLDSTASMLSGFGVRVQMDANLDKREMGMQVVPYMGSADLLSVMVAAEDEIVYFGAPDFLPDSSYGINTVTMMQDLENMGADVGEAAQVSFNFFDLMELVRERIGNAEENQKLLEEANAELIGALEVEKDGKANVRVNGTNTKCNVYIVTIPQNALENWLETVEEISTSVDYLDVMEEVWQNMNLPEDIVDELVDEMAYSYSEPDFSALYDVLDELGDVELEVYVKSSKVAAVKYEAEIDGSDVEASLHLGGGDRYVDNVSLELVMGDYELVISSEGDHSAKEGVFTDETSISITEWGYTTEMELTTEYDPKADSDNLSVTLRDESTSVELEGTYLADKKGLELGLDELSVVMGGEEYMSLGIRYAVTGYEKRVDVDGARLLSEMNEDDIMQIMTDVETNAMNWAYELLEKYPDLMYMF